MEHEWRFASAQETAEAIFQTYDWYDMEIDDVRSKPISVKDYFANYFSGRRPESGTNTAFFGRLQQLVSELVQQLSCETAQEAAAVSERVVIRMLRPKDWKGEGSGKALMLVGVEQLAAPLLPYLERPALQAIRDEYLRHNPKRKMYPKQRELLKEMEHFLQA